jgi:putative zinc finger/helix-turn-helix YgiT family protein
MSLPEEQRGPVPANAHRRPFPWRCSNCKKKEVRLSTVPYTAKVKQDGRIYELAIQALEIPKCDACGELVFNDGADEQVSAALRDYLHLLTPDQIRRARKALGLTQRELSNRLGVAEATLSRWETGEA